MTFQQTAFLPWCVLAVCLIARWVLVVGFGDVGLDYDLVSRLMAGQWQGRDFFAIFPPLPGYSLLLFMQMLGDHYLVVNIHLWFWWLVNAVVTAALMVTWGGSAGQAALAGTTVALLTSPPNSGAKSMEFMAVALSGLAVILFVWYFKGGRKNIALLAGLLGGTSIFAKPNVGLAIVASIIVLCLAIAIFDRRARARSLNAAPLILLGSALGALLAVAIPGFYGGYRELVTQIFVGGSEIKGGLLELVLRTFPRVSTGITNPYRYLIELALVLPVLIGFAALWGWALGSRLDDPPSGADGGREVRALLWLLCGFTIALSVWSLFPREFPHRLTTMFYEWKLVSLPFFLVQMLYAIAAVGLTMSVTVGIIRREFSKGGSPEIYWPFWASLLSLVWTMGVVVSGRYNSVFAATLFVPALALRFQGHHERAFERWLIACLVVWTLAWHVAPNWRSTFADLTRLPENSKFSGLYWPDGGAGGPPGSYPVWASSRTIEQLLANVGPRVQGKSVLWLVAGPGAAFGGNVYRYGVHCLASNNIPSWGERSFAEKLRASPPDYIVSSTFETWDDPKWSFLRPQMVEPWLRVHYRLVWMSSDNPAPLFLWEKT